MGISMDPAIIIIAGLFGLAVLIAGIAISNALKGRDPVSRRLGEMQAQNGGPETGLGGTLRGAGMAILEKVAQPAKPKQAWQASRMRKELLMAGYRSSSAVQVYLGIKMLLALLVPAILYFLTPLPERLSGPLLVLALNLGACVAFILPGIFLSAKAQRRREAIVKELPEVLDLLVIAVESGLGLDAAIKRVGRETRVSCPVLSLELMIVSLELKAGVARDKALRNLSDRCGVEEVSGLVSMLNQADRFGVSVGRSLRIHSDTVRTKWRQKMEERAAKVPLKLLFPVLFMIFPAIMVVMAGPAIIRVSETILK